VAGFPRRNSFQSLRQHLAPGSHQGLSQILQPWAGICQRFQRYPAEGLIIPICLVSFRQLLASWSTPGVAAPTMSFDNSGPAALRFSQLRPWFCTKKWKERVRVLAWIARRVARNCWAICCWRLLPIAQLPKQFTNTAIVCAPAPLPVRTVSPTRAVQRLRATARRNRAIALFATSSRTFRARPCSLRCSRSPLRNRTQS